MLCNIKPVPFHESDKHIFAKIPGGGGPDPGPPSGSAHEHGGISQVLQVVVQAFSYGQTFLYILRKDLT